MIFTSHVTNDRTMAVTEVAVNQQNDYSGVVPEQESPAIDLLIEFMNTFDEESGDEELPDDDACAAWFQGHGLSSVGVVAAEAREVRTALRAAVDGEASPVDGLGPVALHAAVTDDGELVLK